MEANLADKSSGKRPPKRLSRLKLGRITVAVLTLKFVVCHTWGQNRNGCVAGTVVVALVWILKRDLNTQ